MTLNFPTSPQTNDIYTLGDKTWKWNGNAWVLTQGSTPPGSSDPTLQSILYR